MSKKYVIEIKPEYEDTIKGVMVLGARESNLYVDTLSIEDLEELNSDYINEHFGSLQDEAYQRGLNDAKEEKASCQFCMFKIRSEDDIPCKDCCNRHINCFRPMEDNRIEVGDEVKWNSVVIVITRFCEDGEFNWCDGISQDGRVFRVLAENVRKTGKHYDIQSILEAMKWATVTHAESRAANIGQNWESPSATAARFTREEM